eukprot:754526-Hanusia_phi.AAC.3
MTITLLSSALRSVRADRTRTRTRRGTCSKNMVLGKSCWSAEQRGGGGGGGGGGAAAGRND